MFVYIVYIKNWVKGCGSFYANPAFETYGQAVAFANGLVGVEFEIRREFES